MSCPPPRPSHPFPPRDEDLSVLCPIDYTSSHKQFIRAILEQALPLLLRHGPMTSGPPAISTTDGDPPIFPPPDITTLSRLLEDNSSDAADFIYDRLHPHTVAILEALLNERNLRVNDIIKTVFAVLTGYLAFIYDSLPEGEILRAHLDRYHVLTAGLIDYEYGKGYRLTLINHTFLPITSSHDLVVPLHELPVIQNPAEIMGIRCRFSSPTLSPSSPHGNESLEASFDSSTVDSGLENSIDVSTHP